MTNPKTQPRTAAGRAFLEEGEDRFYDWTAMAGDVKRAVLAIEAEAAEQSVPLDVERLALYIHQARTSNDEPIYDMTEARRRAEIIRRRLVDGAQATPQPAVEYSGMEPARAKRLGVSRYNPFGKRINVVADTPAAHPAGSADTALPLGSTSNGALDNAQGPNQLQGNVSRPAGSADTALHRLVDAIEAEWELPEERTVGYDDSRATEAHREVIAAVEQARAALAARPTSAEDSEREECTTCGRTQNEGHAADCPYKAEDSLAGSQP